MTIQILSPKSQSELLVIGIWDLGFGIWDLGFGWSLVNLPSQHTRYRHHIKKVN